MTPAGKEIEIGEIEIVTEAATGIGIGTEEIGGTEIGTGGTGTEEEAGALVLAPVLAPARGPAR